MGTPLGFKTFNTGDVLTAADTNGYLMQGVWTFASAAARDAAVTSPQEGNMCYLKDTDAVQYYSGSTWVAVNASGGGMTSLASGSLSGASVVLSSISSSYTNLKLVIFNFRPATTDATFYVRVNADSTANRYSSNTSGSSTYSFNSTGWQVSQSQTASSGNGYISIDIPNYLSTGNYRVATGLAITDSTTTSNYYNSTLIYNQTTAVSSLTVLPSSGNFTSGTYILYGVK